jgi:hypothetical protein
MEFSFLRFDHGETLALLRDSGYINETPTGRALFSDTA